MSERMVRSSRIRTLCAVCVFLVFQSLADAQSISYDGSFRFSQGRYTLDETVSSAFWLNELSISSSDWWLQLTVPVLYQDSGFLSYVAGMPMPSSDEHGNHHDGGTHPDHGGGGMPGDDQSPQQVGQVGLADPYLRVGAIVYRDVFDRNSVGAFLSVKAPVAEQSKGFGTGEWDFGAGVSWFRQTGQTRFFAELAYWTLGENADLSLEDPIAFELKYGRRLAASTYLLEVALRGRSETSTGVDGPLAAELSVSRDLRSRGSVYFSTEAGLSESAPDYALAIGYRTRVWQRSGERSRK